MTDPTDAYILTYGSARIQRALRIFRYIQERGGATSDDCTQALGIPHEVCSPRFAELVRAGCLRKTSRKKKTTLGGNATVYEVASVNFNRYLTRVKKRTSREGQILDASNHFLREWHRNLPAKRQSQLLQQLVAALEKANS